MRGQRFPSLGLRWIDIFQHGIYPDVTVVLFQYAKGGALTLKSPI
ncbi:hypothetical protein VC87395_000403 [Vibrio paracholerae 87395]|nr:hypothetical protein VC87395_000403 [Vibrio paracholerae 87395]